MAKAEAQTKPQENLPATSPGKGQVSAEMMEAMQGDAGAGVSTDQADNLVPLIYVLDAKSPQVDENDAKYIRGAKPGSIWLRNYSTPIVEGSAGVLFQPCWFYKDWVEWRLRTQGGGFVKAHEWNDDLDDGTEDAGRPKEAKKGPHPENPKKEIWFMANGNEVKCTRHHVGFVLFPEGQFAPFAISLSSTGHTTSKNWMFTMMNNRLPNGQPEPSYARGYRLRTKQRSNAQGKWYVLEHMDEGYVAAGVWGMDQYRRGKLLHEAFKAGTAKVEAQVQDNDAAGGGASSDDGKM